MRTLLFCTAAGPMLALGSVIFRTAAVAWWHRQAMSCVSAENLIVIGIFLCLVALAAILQPR